uniref:26S proteasome non-ATPase regulatory subunit RPN1 C-terminal domain-containing protein n=1 Tax=Aegilops tauschii subsp. strangulata TaxID=200361 RepID=A0A453SPX0_AEGTS
MLVIARLALMNFLAIFRENSSENLLFEKNELGKASAVASLGMIHLWDHDSGFAILDKYLQSDDTHVVAGALLGIGIVSCGVKNDYDPALALISGYSTSAASITRIGAILGLGIAYAGSRKDKLKSLFLITLSDSQAPLVDLVFSAISLGLVFVGSCNEEIAQSIISVLKNLIKAELAEPIIRLLPVSIGLLYLGKQETFDEIMKEVSKTFDKIMKDYWDVTLMSLAYAGTGNVLKVQELLSICSKKEGGSHQGPAVLGIALIAMAEELGVEMAVRSLEQLFKYGDYNIRRAVPLALGMLYISNPKVDVVDTLSRLSNDADGQVMMAATISLGLIGAGTNNARIAELLRKLSSQEHGVYLFCVRIAQGLVHLGKGLLTLAPYHSDRLLLSPVALAGLVTVLHACLNMQPTILGEYPYMLYILALAMQPRMLLTLDEDLKPLPVPVHVGQAVDVVSQAGSPRTITGFQTHNTPVLLAAGERAELATEKYIPLTPILEGFVILRKNPEHHED